MIKERVSEGELVEDVVSCAIFLPIGCEKQKIQDQRDLVVVAVG